MVLSLYIRPLLFLNLHTFSQFIRLFFSFFPWTQHPVAPTLFFPTLLSSSATWLLWQRCTKWRQGAESWKAQSGSHFPTVSGPCIGRERRVESLPSGQFGWVFSAHVREKIIFVLFFFSFLMCCANKAIGTLAFLKNRDKGTTHYDFNLFQAHKEKENTCTQSGDVTCTAFNYRPLSQWNWNARQSNSIRIHHPVQKKAQNISNTLGYLQSPVCVCIISLSGQNCLRLELKTLSHCLREGKTERRGEGGGWSERQFTAM